MTEQPTWSEDREMAVYRPGQKVEIKRQPGVVDTVIAYDPYMVPPIVLAIDPQPRYPEELSLIAQPGMGFDWFKPLSRAITARKIATDRQPLAASHRR
jgi:hypothetical protein